jgi:hypothetical protein
LVDPNTSPLPPDEAVPFAEEVPVAENIFYAEPADTTIGVEFETAYATEESGEAAAMEYQDPVGQEDQAATFEATPEPVEDFLATASEFPESEPQSRRVPELLAAPAELKELAPRRLGPPAGWEAGTEVPPMEVAPVSPQAVWEEPVEFAQDVVENEVYDAGAYAEQPDQGDEQPYEVQPYEVQPYEEQPYEVQPYEVQPYEEQPVEAAASVPMAIPLRPRVPTPLTSPHSDRPATRRVTQQVRASTGHTTRHHTGLAAPHGQTTQTIPAKYGPPVVAAPRLLPAWVLVVVGLLIGAVAALVAVVKSPLRDKIGLMERTQANAYVLAVLKEERKQVQAMLDEYHRNAKVALADDMAEFRAEEGRKAPERMTLQEFAAEIKEQEALKKEEEEEDKKAAEEEAKATGKQE